MTQKQDLPSGNVIAFSRRPPSEEGLWAEMARRVERMGYNRLLARQKATGLRVPAAAVQLKDQIEYAATALARLDRLPDNFRADHFWPS